VTPLYERLGGEAAVEAAVVLFYDKVMNDADLGPFFEGFDLHDQIVRHVTFMTRAFGGRVSHDVNLTAAHKNLVDRGLDDRHVDVFVRLLGEVLGELGVGEEDAAEVKAHLEANRGRVLGRAR